jgi:hypothetical protein
VRRRRTLVFAMMAVLALVSAGGTVAGMQASRIVDRTVVCQMPGEGFPDSTRFMSVAAMRGNRRSGAFPLMNVGNGPSGQLRALVTTGPVGRYRTGSVVLNRTECATTDLRIPLTAKGLRGGLVKPHSASYRCDVPVRVLIRVRAEFTRPTGFTSDPQSPFAIFARGRIMTAYLAVTTVRGRKPLAFMSVHDATGRARVFISPSSCVRAK